MCQFLSVVAADEIIIKDRKKENGKPAQLLIILTNKKAYSILISGLRKEIESYASQIRILYAGTSKISLPHLYMMSFTVTSEAKLSMFQYKILHNTLPTNSMLYKIGKVDSPKMPPLCARITRHKTHVPKLSISKRFLAIFLQLVQ